MKKTNKRIISTIAISVGIMLAALSLSACGAANYNAEMPKMKAVGGAGGIGGTYEMAVAETAAAAPMYEEAAYEYDAAESGAMMNGGMSSEVQNPSPNRKLIKNVYMELETKEFDKVTAAISRRVTELGGYIESSSISNPNSYNEYVGRRNMSMSARIPCDRLDEFVQNVESEGNITYKDENVTDITLQYTDTESRKKSLLTEQERLNELMKKAETVEDIIVIESRLSEVRYQLESIESQLRTYDNQVDYSTVNININEVVDYTPVKETSVWERISEGFKASLISVGNFFENLFVGILALSPILLLIAVFIVIIALVIRKIAKKKKASKQKEQPQTKTTETEKNQEKTE